MALIGKAAIVTGAASGIGRAVALKLSSEGANVACVDMTSSSETLKRMKNEGLDIVCDVTNAERTTRLIADAEKGFDGKIPNILVNCAGITRDAFLWKQTESSWDDVQNVNLRAPFILTRAMSRRLLENDRRNESRGSEKVLGSVVNVSSIIGKVGNMGQTNYAASKGGLISFTKAAAQDLARAGIRVNAILPGFIRTPMAEAVPEKILAETTKKIPLGYLGDPDDIASAALFLTTQSYITGACLEVTGGLYM